MTAIEVSHHGLRGLDTTAALREPASGQAFALPRDKSLTHRAIIFAALAEGRSEIHQPLLGEDCLATAAIMSALGVDIGIEPDVITVHSNGAARLAAHSEPSIVLSCGNSGTTARLLLGLFSGLPGLRATLTGDASLSKRPMGRVTALIDDQSQGLFSPKDRLPIAVAGTEPRPREFAFAKASGQVKSALLLHSLSCPGQVTITLPTGGRDHTEQWLLRQGARLSVAHKGGDEIITFTGPFTPKPGQWRIPADPSSLAFLWVAMLTAGQKAQSFDEVLANPTRIGALKVLARMATGFTTRAECQPSTRGAMVEPTLAVSCPARSELRATDITAAELPTLIDEIPILAVAACFAAGTSRFCDLGELRVKESDRLAETCELLTRAGAKVTIAGDDLVITGSREFKPEPFRYHSAGDHRMVMAAIVLALSCPESCVISDYRAVTTSFPDFAPTLAAVLR